MFDAPDVDRPPQHFFHRYTAARLFPRFIDFLWETYESLSVLRFLTELLTHYSSCLMNSFCFYVMKLQTCHSVTLFPAPCLCRELRSLMMIQRFAASFHTVIAFETHRYVFSQQDVISVCHICFTDNLSCCSPSNRCWSLYLSACCWLDVGLSPAPHSYFKSRGDHGLTFSSWTVERPHSARRGDSVKTFLF